MDFEDPRELKIIFSVEPDLDSGILVASWDDPSGGGITTQANTLSDLVDALRQAVTCHFADGHAPRRASLHFADAHLEFA